MARELDIRITTSADTEKLNELIKGFNQLEEVIKKFGRKNALTNMSNNLNDAKNSVAGLNREVIKLNRNLRTMVGLLDPIAKGGNTNAAMSKVTRAQAQTIAKTAQLQKATDREIAASRKQTMAQIIAMSNRVAQAETKEQNARVAAQKKANTAIIRDANQAAAAQQRALLNSVKLRRTTYDADVRAQQNAFNRMNNMTRNLFGSRANPADGFMGTLFQKKGTAFDSFTKNYDKLMRSQTTQMQRTGDAQKMLTQAEQNMKKFWNTTDAGAQNLTKRGFSKSLSEMGQAMKKLQGINLNWNDEIKGLQRFQAELKDTQNDLRRMYSMQNEQRRSYLAQGDTKRAGLVEKDMRETLTRYRTTQAASSEVDTRIGNIRAEQAKISAAVAATSTAMQRGEKASAAYHSRLHQLAKESALSAANFKRLQASIQSMLNSFNRAAGAVSQFAGALRSRLNSAFSAANASIKTLSSNVSSRFASMRAQLDSTGKTFLGFGRQAKTGFNQADIALNEFFSAGWSLLASGSIVKMFGSNILRGMMGGLTEYSGLEQQMVRLGISSGMWQPATETGTLPTGETIYAGQASPYAPGDMRGMEELIFGLQSGRLAGGSSRPMTAFNATQLTDALYFFSSAIGSDLLTQGEATARALDPLLRVATVTQTDPELLIKGSLNTLMQYGYDPRAMIKAGETDMFTQMAGMVAVASNVSSMEVSDVFEAFKMMGPALNKLTGATEGAGLEDAMAAIFMASEVGLKGGNVGRGLDRLVTQLMDPDGPMKEVIKKYFGDDATIKDLFFNDKGYLEGGLKGVFDTLLSSGLEGPQLASLMGELFTQNAARAGIGLLDPDKLRGSGPGSWNWFLSMMEEGRIDQFMATATAAMEGTVTASMTNMGNAWQMIKTMIVESVRGDLIDAFTRFAEVLWDIGYAIKDNPALGRFVAFLGLLAGGIATAVGGMMVFGGTILLVARAFTMLGGMLAPVLQLLVMLPSILASVSPLFLLMGAAAAVAFVAWDQNLRGIQDRIRSFADSLSFDGFMEGVADVLTWAARIGDAFISLAEGPILGLTDTADNLQALLQDVFGDTLGALATQGLFDLGKGIRNFITNTDMGTGRLASFRSALSDVGTVVDNIGPALRGLGDIFLFGFADMEGAGAIKTIADILGIEDYGTKTMQFVQGVRYELSLLGGLAQTVGTAWQSAFDAVVNAFSQLTGGNNAMALIGAAILFANSVAVGFATTLTRVANLIEALANRAAQAFSNLSKSLSDTTREIKGIEFTVTGAISAIGGAIGVYLGARLITALMPGFALITRLGAGLMQLGAIFVGIGAQVALFGARVATALALTAVQIAAVTAQLLIQATAWTAANALQGIQTLLTNADTAAKAAHTAMTGAQTAATLGFSGALGLLNTMLMASIALFGAVLLVVGGFAIGLFAVTAATQGFDAAIAATVSFLEAFWQGLQIGVAFVEGFISILFALGTMVGNIMEPFMQGASAIEKFGMALGLIGSVALVGIVAALASFIGLIGSAVVGFLGFRGAAALAILALGNIGFGLIGLAGPFETLLDVLDKAIEKFGIFGEVAAVAMFSASGRSWVGAIGRAAFAILKNHPAILAGAGIALGTYAAYEMIAPEDDPAIGSLRDIAQTTAQAASAGPNVLYTEQWMDVNAGDQPFASDEGWWDMMETLIQKGVYTQAQAQSMWDSGDADAALRSSWFDVSESNPIPGMSRYLAGEFRGRTPGLVSSHATPDQVYNQVWDAVWNAVEGDEAQKKAQADYVAAATKQEYSQAQATAYQDIFAATGSDQVAISTAYGPNAFADPLETNKITQKSTLGEAQTWLDTMMTTLGLDESLGNIANSKFVKDNMGFFTMIGMDPMSGDWTPDLEGLMNVSKDAAYDPIIESLFPGLEDYRTAVDEYTAFQKMVEGYGGDTARAAEDWMLLTGKAAPTGPPDPMSVWGEGGPQKAIETASSPQNYIDEMVAATESSMLLVDSLAAGWSALYGETSAGRAFGTVAEGIMANLAELEYADGTNVLEANKWFDMDELLANAALGGDFGMETAGKNLHRSLRPMLEGTAAELGVSVDALLADIPKYFYDEALMPTVQTLLYSELEQLGPDVGAKLDTLGMEVDESTGRVFSEMGMDWGDLAAYAAGQAMEGNEWDLSHFLMEQWDITQAEASAYIEQNGLDARIINDETFEGVRAAYLSSNGEVAAATTEFWEWMAEATDNGANNMVSITEEEFKKIPEAYRILASNQGIRFNIIDENDVEHQVANLLSVFDQVANAKGELDKLLSSPGVSNINQLIGGEPGGTLVNGRRVPGNAPITGGGSYYDLPGTGEVESLLNLNRMLQYGADEHPSTLGLKQVGEEVDGMITLVNEINGMQITIPAVDLQNLRQGADDMEAIFREEYDKYKDDTQWVYKDGKMTGPMSYDEWIRAGAGGMIDENGEWIGPKMSEEASAALIFGANVDWDGAITLAQEKTLAIANAVQGTWDRSFSSDTQVKGAIDDMLDTAFEGLETVETRAAEAGKAIREAIVNALGGGMGDEPQEENAGTPQRGAGPGTEGPTAAGPFDSQFTSYGTSAGIAFGEALDAALKVEIDGINFVGEGTATGGPFNSEFEGFARLAATAFGNIMTEALPAAIAPAGAGITLMATGWGTSAGAAFASAFAAAMSGIGGTGGTGTGGGNIGADGSTTPYGPGGGMGIVSEGSTGAQPVQIPVSLDFTQYDLDIASLNEHIPLIDAATASIDVSIDFTQYDLDIASLNEHIPLIDAASATIDVGIDTTEYFNGAGMVLTSLTLLDKKTATPIINVTDNATTTLNNIISLINSIPTSKTSTINVNTNNTTTNTVINRVGVGPTPFHSGGVVATDWQLVGEKGPELVQLPRGSMVHNNWDSGRMLDQGMLAASPFTTQRGVERSAPVNNNVHVTINNPVVRSDHDIKEITKQVSRELGRSMEAATRGQRPRY